tara:strand:- start:2318 stop:3061 length:744 start_codon:yes stop_codon:yes gene_type:complete
MHNNFRLLAVILMFGAGPSFAEGLEPSLELNNAPIVDISTDSSNLSDEIAAIKQQVQVLQQQNILSKVKELQAEIQSLRGTLEMQEHNFAKSGLISAPSSERSSDKKSIVSNVVADSAVKDLSVSSEIENYNNAFAILKERDYEGATKAFNNFLVNFPDGKYSTNANYWLGEIYLLKGQYKDAELSFRGIIENHADHGKAPDAIFKLAMVYVNTNEIDKAKDLVAKLEVSYPNTTAYRMAKIQLRNI